MDESCTLMNIRKQSIPLKATNLLTKFERGNEIKKYVPLKTELFGIDSTLIARL